MANGGTFVYEAQTADGRPFRGTLEAASTDDAQARLTALQLRVLSVSLAEGNGHATSRRGLGMEDFLVFNQQLAHLTEAGMPIERGLRLIALDMRSGKLAQAAKDVAADLEKGTPLQEAFARNASRFPPLYGKLVEAGARAGALPAMLFNLGKHMELTARLRQSLWRTLSYPLMVLGALSLVLLMISTYVLPHFEGLYAEFKIEPLLITRIMIAAGHVYPMLFAALVIVLVLIGAIDVSIKASGGEGIRLAPLFVRVPLIGGILRASLLSRWIDALRLGIEAGLDLPRAIALATEATAGAGGPLAREARQLAAVVSEGRPIGTFTGRVIPATVPAALELAGHSADLPAALHSLTKMYEEQAEHKLRLLPSVLTPLLMLIVAGSIGFCIAALFTPMMQFMQGLMQEMGGLGP